MRHIRNHTKPFWCKAIDNAKLCEIFWKSWLDTIIENYASFSVLKRLKMTNKLEFLS